MFLPWWLLETPEGILTVPPSPPGLPLQGRSRGARSKSRNPTERNSWLQMLNQTQRNRIKRRKEQRYVRYKLGMLLYPIPAAVSVSTAILPTKCRNDHRYWMSTIISNRDTALVNVLLMQSPLVIQINTFISPRNPGSKRGVWTSLGSQYTLTRLGVCVVG